MVRAVQSDLGAALAEWLGIRDTPLNCDFHSLAVDGAVRHPHALGVDFSSRGTVLRHHPLAVEITGQGLHALTDDLRGDPIPPELACRERIDRVCPCRARGDRDAYKDED